MLEPRILELVDLAFAQEDQAQAREMLERFEPYWGRSDRALIAAIKYSQGQISRLKVAIVLGESDVRDLLCEAGFAHDTKAHLHWIPGQK
ncbi:MAG: hypothetical protein ABL309_08325 [Phycisphaerales bacterium]